MNENTPLKIRWWNVVAIALIAIGGSFAAFSDASNHRSEITNGIQGMSKMVILSAPDTMRGSVSDAIPSMTYNSTYNTMATDSVGIVSILALVGLVFFISIAIFYMRCCA